jgi:glutathione-regulated potassium-efflux system protein KefB
MAGEAAAGGELAAAVALLAAGVGAATLFRRAGLGSVLGYLAAGVAIGPYGLKLFSDPETMLHIAEIGVVLFLFLIGLEMRPAKLWAMRQQIFGLGLSQVLTAGGLLTGVGVLAGLALPVAFVAAMGFVLSSTAVIAKMLDERGETNTPEGQRAISILLLEDISIVPLLAIVAVLGAAMASANGTAVDAAAQPWWMTAGLAIGVIIGVIIAGRFLLNPMFRFLAQWGGRDVMTAAALLVVLAAALAMQLGGLSMAMGAFLAGVLLSESSFRHQLEADVDPFRGILLGLFFLSVGMSLNLTVVMAQWPFVVAGVAAFMATKAIAIYGVARLFKADHRDALQRSVLFAQGGEFAFVLYAAALAAGVFNREIAGLMGAIVILSMAITPILVVLMGRLLPAQAADMTGVDKAEGLTGDVLVIGFGRFAQVASQGLLARGVDVSIIDNDPEMIQAAAKFGFKVYFGDGSRLDVLHASGADRAEAILVCIDKPEAADRIVELAKQEFPHAKLFVRAYDRGHSLRLIRAGVDYELRETFESALTFSQHVMEGLGVDPEEAAETIADVRARDAERLALQLAQGIEAGRGLLRGNLTTPQPAPYVRPQRKAAPLNAEAADAIKAEAES